MEINRISYVRLSGKVIWSRKTTKGDTLSELRSKYPSGRKSDHYDIPYVIVKTEARGNTFFVTVEPVNQ